MTSNSHDQVSVTALLRSHPVPNTWAQTFGWSRNWWINQENGLCADRPRALWDWDDVRRMFDEFG